jgi:hypothetical protein
VGRRYMNISLLYLQSRPSDETRRKQERGSGRKEQESNQKKKTKDKATHHLRKSKRPTN